MRTLLIIGGIAVVLLVGALLAWWVRRYLYRESIRQLGWEFESNPGEQITYGMNVPPFGIGYGRRVDDYIAGQLPTGAPFRSFEYSAPGYEGRVAAVGLSIAQPPAFYSYPSQMRVGSGGYSGGSIGPVEVVAPDPRYAALLVETTSAQAHEVFTHLQTDLSVDGQWLVATGAPRKAAELKTFLEVLAPLARAIETGPTANYPADVPPPEMSFYGRPDWVYRNRDDAALQLVTVSWYGQNHHGEHVVYARNDGLPMVALDHTWETTRTEYYTDSQGDSQSRTVTDHHSEMACELQLPFPFLNVSINDAPSVGQQVRFESIDFDQAFRVHCPNPRFASDVFHPRMMEWLLAYQPASFQIENGIMRFYMGANAPEYLMHCADFAHGFFSRVPEFVWKDLGATPPPFRQV